MVFERYMRLLLRVLVFTIQTQVGLQDFLAILQDAICVLRLVDDLFLVVEALFQFVHFLPLFFDHVRYLIVVEAVLAARV